MDWEREETVPSHVFDTFAKANMLIPSLPAPLPVEWLKKLGIGDILGVVKVEEWDYIHTAIFCDEMSRSGLAGPGASLTTGMAFGVPPMIEFGSQALQEKFLPDLLLGSKRTCIAITEPGAGSDVANIETTAEKTQDGKFYVINGSKKWSLCLEENVLHAVLTMFQDHQRYLVSSLYDGCPNLWSRTRRLISPHCPSSRLPGRQHAAS